MNISPFRFNYIGTYSTINNPCKKFAFPYKIKVEGYRNGKQGNSLFNLASVTITDLHEKEKYGTGKINGPIVFGKTKGCKKPEDYNKVSKEKVGSVELPESFDKLKNDSRFYYHGEKVSDYELIQTAIASGKMTLPDNIAKGDEARLAHEAFDVLVRDEAKPKNSWSKTLYSEDGKYTFTIDAKGKYSMHLLDDAGVGASVDDIANWMMSGTPNRNIEKRYLDYLRTVDPDLYNTAMKIGKEVRTYGYMEDLYNQGVLSQKQNDYDMTLLGLMFGEDSGSMRIILDSCRKKGNYSQLLDLYNVDGATLLDSLRERQIENGGIL
ncbi:MAG: hypothetical protein MSG78_05875 [Clostridiales bacterium]|nr:hypothetical protein [Clostridiales bacterium]